MGQDISKRTFVNAEQARERFAAENGNTRVASDLLAYQPVENGGQAPLTASHSSGFLISVGASPRFSTGCNEFEAYRVDRVKTHCVESLGNQIQQVQSILEFAFDAGMIADPVRNRIEEAISQSAAKIEGVMK